MASFSFSSSPGTVADDGEPQFILPDRGGGGGGGVKPSKTNAQAAVQLTRANIGWNGPGVAGQATTVTYAFSAAAPGYDAGVTGFSRFSGQQIVATELALRSWSDVANITFQRVGAGTSGENAYSNAATLLFSNYAGSATGAASFGYSPAAATRGAADREGDVWINAGLADNAALQSTGFGLLTLTRQIGQSIGLGQPGDYPAGALNYAAHGAYYEDSQQYTVMSPFGAVSTAANHRTPAAGVLVYASAPLLDDIAAAQRLYGANMSTRAGDTIYGFNATADRPWFAASGAAAPLIFAVWDAAGYDTFDFSGYAQSQQIDLRETAFSNVGGMRGNVAIAAGVVIEAARGGSGADLIIGNAAANTLSGGDGSDTLTGGAGDDLLDGGAGFDRATFAASLDAVTLQRVGFDYVVATSEGRDVTRDVEELSFADGSIFTLHVLATSRSYLHLLGRDAQGRELATWTSYIQSGGDQGAVVKSIVADDAAAARAQQLVTQYYETYLGRRPSESEAVSWKNSLASGSMSLQRMQGVFLGQDGAEERETAFITDAFRSWLGRDAALPEIGLWKTRFGSLEFTPLQMRLALINDPSAPEHINAKISQLYQTWFGRAATAAEQQVWYGLFQSGATYGDLRTALIAEPAGRAHIAARTSEFYTTWIGRAAFADEVATWYGLFREGGDFANLRDALIDNPYGRSHVAAVTQELYDTWLGRAASSAEVAYWYGAFHDGAEFVVLRAALAAEPGARAHAGQEVSQLFETWLGRPATAGEQDSWVGQLSNGARLIDLRAALIAQDAGRAHIAAEVSELYATWIGRAAFADEISTWYGLFRQGGEFSNLRTALIETSHGRAHIVIETQELYGLWLGRPATSAELDVWFGLFRGGAEFRTLIDALMAEPGARAHAAQATVALFETWFGRPATAAEQSQWYESFRDGAQLSDLRAALIAAEAGRTHIAAEIREIYDTWIGRPAYAEEVAVWYGLFRDGGEYRNLRDALIDNEYGRQHIADLTLDHFRSWLGRDPSQEEADLWYDMFVDGLEPRDQRSQLIDSEEGRAHILARTNGMYLDFYGRDPDWDERGGWFDRFLAGDDFTDLRQTLVYSPEGVAHIRATIMQAYRDFFGRNASASELNYWTDAIQRGTEFHQFYEALDSQSAPLVVDDFTAGGGLKGMDDGDDVFGGIFAQEVAGDGFQPPAHVWAEIGFALTILPETGPSDAWLL